MKYLKNLIVISSLLLSFYGFTQVTGTSQEVGITNGQLSVSLSGAATYQIPIAVPPGINGVIPKINLTYNSQSGNGIAGYGWDLSGISKITRIPSTKYHDNVIDGVDFDQYDRFSLDGQRLILKSGNYGSSNASYETENYSNIKVISYGVSPFGSNFGPAYFKVFYPDGTIATYGSTSDSKTRNVWSIKRWQNPQDIRLYYTYENSQNSLFISSIKYGKKGNDDGMNEIQFTYNTRNRMEQAYIGGHNFTNNRILSSVRVKSNHLGYRNYYLNHDTTSLGYERLVSITKKNGDNTLELNPTIFTYEDSINSNNFEYNSILINGLNNANRNNTSYISGDFNGDTKTDIITFPITGSNAKKNFTLFTNINSISLNNGINYQYGHAYEGFKNLFTATIKISSKVLSHQGWIGVDNITNGPNLVIHSFRFENNTVIETSIGRGNISHTGHASGLQKVISGDFNGDGLTDVISFNELTSGAHFIDLFGNDSTNYIGNIDQILRNGSYAPVEYSIQVGDFNGDGKSDFFVIRENQIKVYSLNHNNDSLIKIAEIFDNNIDLNRTHLLGDYNGDGKIDIAMPKPTSNSHYSRSKRWLFLFSTGIGFQSKLDDTNIARFVYEPNDVLFIATDMNGDGKTDILFQETHSGINNLILYENKSVGPYNIKFNSGMYSQSWNAAIGNRPIPILLKNSEKNQNLEYSLINGNTIHMFKSTKDHRQNTLLREIITGNGVSESISYKSLIKDVPINYLQIYQPNHDENHPNINIKGTNDFQVVSSLRKKIGNQHAYKRFSYYGATTNTKGLGFLGFKKTYRTNWFNEFHTPISNVTIHDISNRSVVIEEFSYLGLPPNISFGEYPCPANFINKKTNYYTSTISNEKVFKTQRNSSTSYNGLLNTSYEVNTSYDQYNNPITNTTVIKEGSTIQNTSITTIQYENNPGGFSLSQPYYIGRVKQKNTTNSIGSENHTNEEQFTYFSKMLLKQHKLKGHNTGFITNEYFYDYFGNIITKTVLALNMVNRINRFQYDSTGRFLKQSTNIEGLSTNYTYNDNGYLLSETAPFNLTTSYQYDSWGKQIKSIDYLGNFTTTTYNRDAMPQYTAIVTISNDGSESFSLHDEMNRVKEKGKKDIEGNWSKTATTYDIYNRPVLVSEPFITSPSQYNSYAFDDYGRKIQIAQFNGKITDISFNGLTTIANDGTKIVTSTKNALGQTISLTDNGGTILYEYYANGKLKQTDFDGNITTTEYDGWGRKTKLTDSSAGIYRYTYNIFGETIKEITPKGKTTYILNDIGKLIQKNVSGDNTNLTSTYNYDTYTKLLTSISTNTELETLHVYGYDNYKRIRRISEYNNKAIFFNTITYDNFGRQDTEEKQAISLEFGEDSKVTTKNIYKNGELWKILNDANQQVLWQVNQVNARGQITNYSYGNGINTENTYDNYGFPKEINSYKSSSNIIKLHYDFDHQRGLLMSRNSSLFDFYESFQYDDLDRLTHFTNIQGQKEIQKYDNKGRIRENKFGAYKYNQEKPYQNSSISLTTTGVNFYAEKPTQDIIYNAFKAPVSIIEEEEIEINFEYNIFQQRSRMDYKLRGSNESIKIKYYSSNGNHEIKIDHTQNEIEFITYIGGDAYTAPVIYKTKENKNTFEFLHKDYLGSIIAISNEEATLIEKRAFNAWGETAFIQDVDGNNLEQLTVMDRGYTGHEHLAGINLINMNARLYDAKVHRFLAPDNYIQDPYNTQNYNRYGYVLNNPLGYTDITGEIAVGAAAVLVAAAIGAIVGGVMVVVNGGSTFDIISGALLGAVIGGMSSGVGNLAAGSVSVATNTIGFWSGAASGASSGFTGAFLGTTIASMQNGSGIGDSLMSGLKSGLIGGVIGGTISGVSAGIRANKIGLDFFDADEVINSAQFNSLTDISSNDVACSDCNFMQGERISDFKADLSKKNDFGQLKKAYKKANLYTSYFKKPIKMGELFDYSTSKDWHTRGWRFGNGEWSKGFRYEKEVLKAIVGGSSARNSYIGSVSVGYYNNSYQIRVFSSGYYSDTYLTNLNFNSASKTNWSAKLMDYINDFTQF